MESKSKEAREEIGIVLKFFGVKPTNNLIRDLTSIIDLDMDKRTLRHRFYKFMFDYYDSDGNGRIDAKELKLLLTDIGTAAPDEPLNSVTEETIKNALEVIDKDGSGTVEYKEFEQWLDGIFDN